MNWAWFSLALAVFTFPAHLLLASQIPETRLAHSGLSSEFISLKYALAAEVATVLNLSASDSNAATGIQITKSPQRALREAALAHEVEVLGPYRIITDEGSNSLLVSASLSDLVKIKGIIARLDVVLAQILIDAAILELPLEARSPADVPGKAAPSSRLGALTNLGVLSSTRFKSAQARGAERSQGSEFSYAVSLSDNLDAALGALVTNRGVRVLQRPRILTSDGVPVQMFIGSVPPRGGYSGGSYYGPTSIPLLQTNETVGVTIEVSCFTPADGFVLKEIQQEVQMFAGTETIIGVGGVPIVARRRSSAQVAMKDRQIILLGGCIQTNKTPIFSEIDQLKRLHSIGNFINRLIAYPKRKTYIETVILLRATVLPAAKVVAARNTMPSVKQAQGAIMEEELKRLRQTEKAQCN